MAATAELPPAREPQRPSPLELLAITVAFGFALLAFRDWYVLDITSLEALSAFSNQPVETKNSPPAEVQSLRILVAQDNPVNQRLMVDGYIAKPIRQ